MSIYRKYFTVSAADVSMCRAMRPSMLLQLMQEAAFTHNEELGVSREKMLESGLLWMVTHHFVQITRMPSPGEELTLESWPGPTRHVMFPRYSRISDGSGNTLVNASSVWVLADSVTRSIAFPAQYCVSLPGEVTGYEAPIPWRIEEKETDHRQLFTVPFSYADTNGHMNNARYFDLAETCIPAAYESGKLIEMRCEYHRELLPGQTVRIDWGCGDGEFYLCGGDEKPYFRLSMKYE